MGKEADWIIDQMIDPFKDDSVMYCNESYDQYFEDWDYVFSTEKATLLRVGDKQFWCPKSIYSVCDEVLSIPGWFKIKWHEPKKLLPLDRTQWEEL